MFLKYSSWKEKKTNKQKKMLFIQSELGQKHLDSNLKHGFCGENYYFGTFLAEKRQ